MNAFFADYIEWFNMLIIYFTFHNAHKFGPFHLIVGTRTAICSLDMLKQELNGRRFANDLYKSMF